MLHDGSLREILATAIVVLLVYLATLAFRLARLRRQMRRDAAAAGGAEAATATATGDLLAGSDTAASAPAPDLGAHDAASPAASASPVAPPPEAPRLSPVHEKAAALAREGLDTATIARRCGISQSEAELVCWLARHREAAP
jgi:hypothetical protein